MARELELPSERVYRELRALVDGMAPSAQLPATRELAVQLSSSKKTVSRVLARLAEERLIVIKARWGAFKAPE